MDYVLTSMVNTRIKKIHFDMQIVLDFQTITIRESCPCVKGQFMVWMAKWFCE